jgi:hypothetical protein
MKEIPLVEFFVPPNGESQYVPRPGEGPLRALVTSYYNSPLRVVIYGYRDIKPPKPYGIFKRRPK